MSSSTLVPSLLRDHAQMRELLEEVRRSGIGSNEGQQKLTRARRLIVEHLRREDAELYPALRQCADTQKLADDYADEMQKLSCEILAFFDGMEHEHDNLVFARGFGHLMGTLNKRWTREEVRLYPAYNMHCTGLKKAG